MNKVFDRILYGGDYNPNQWSENIWEEDMRLFELASINSATINVFSWAKIQPSENVYDFTELDKIVDTLSRSGVRIVMGTSTAAMPAWLYKRYPEVGRVDFEGRRHKFGLRHNACPNSLVYQKYASELVDKLVQRYENNKNIVCWHVNNEYGGECHCENCEKEFRIWLRKKYKTLVVLNKAWNMEFWGHIVHNWDEIVLPNALSDALDYDTTTFSGISLDYRRFNSDSMLNNFKMERDIIRKADSNIPITTNIMGTYKNLDYFKWAKEMDIVSWDSYPAYNTPWSMVAMQHDLMRSIKNKPFMLMEQTPSQQNWQPYNSLKRPGQMRAQSYQTLARGADTIQFFQLRRSLGACEKFHGAVISHEGSENTRVFGEVAQLGRELNSLGTNILGTMNTAKVGIVFDWDNFWALEYSSGPNKDLKYVDQIHQYYKYFYQNNIAVDMLPFDADFSKYDLIVAPVLYMCKEGMQQSLESFVEKGGVFVTTFMSGIVDDSDNVHLGGYPGPLRKLCGVWVEEIDALAPERTNAVKFADGGEHMCNLLCDIIHLESAEALAVYTQDFYAATPAVTENKFKQGKVYYAGTQLEYSGLAEMLDKAVQTAGITTAIQGKTELEIVRRVGDDKVFTFVINFSASVQALPAEIEGQKDMLTGKLLDKDTVLNQYDVLVVCQ